MIRNPAESCVFIREFAPTTCIISAGEWSEELCAGKLWPSWRLFRADTAVLDRGHPVEPAIELRAPAKSLLGRAQGPTVARTKLTRTPHHHSVSPRQRPMNPEPAWESAGTSRHSVYFLTARHRPHIDYTALICNNSSIHQN